MVSTSDILLNNTSLLSPGSGPVCALVGCTEGIGLATLHAVLRHTSAPTIYLVGETARLDALKTSVQSLNASANIVPIVVTPDEGSNLVSCAQDAAREMVALNPPRLDLLIMSSTSPSPSPSADISLTEEGIDRTICAEYCARMRILVTLLPLLRLAASPRVVSVLAGGREGRVDVDDLGTPRTTEPSTTAAAATMTTLFFEYLAAQVENDKIVFLHVNPGVVFGGVHTSVDEAEGGERVLFAATNGRFRRVRDPERARGTLIQQGSDGVLGSGVYLVNGDSSVVEGGGSEELKRLRRDTGGGVVHKIWEYTMGRVCGD
ncbi:hypothetical protein Z517_03376 [Fonsecaea pedrosoi CBS 271.37]|uniref:Ketoreductase (KR) domain-containing protein n=1 Tax=Fonsecaea pedrosoi CBS 271.37 TaxID=1442368 RepID=A0A0D2HI69_9EURO|nr:uncharacterized protein Z517_03376 [Fonsecaea pedrosoi CBS 271.37]KIW84129.1 hypothetical protein Z517_03376 [Fonsecaea pedrosoi CBS 271.37]